jgi:hypothetical protein
MNCLGLLHTSAASSWESKFEWLVSKNLGLGGSRFNHGRALVADNLEPEAGNLELSYSAGFNSTSFRATSSYVLKNSSLQNKSPGRLYMKYRKLGRTGFEVSDMAHGLWGMSGWSGSDDQQSLAAMQLAVDLGCNFFDTAWAYG